MSQDTNEPTDEQVADALMVAVEAVIRAAATAPNPGVALAALMTATRAFAAALTLTADGRENISWATQLALGMPEHILAQILTEFLKQKGEQN
jgi:hypothetical protein